MKEFLSLLVFVCLSAFVSAQGFEFSIFEDEDIYNQALPPKPHTGITVPGTKWCGPGNTANSYEDLGMHRDTDKCCRQHDHCPNIIESQSTIHGLHNPDLFPILSCKCEQEFINCLQSVNTMVSNTMGQVYFGTRHKCFAEGHPLISCKEYQNGTFRRRCIRYTVNKNLPKVWQFYDIPFYSISSAKLNRMTMTNG